MNRGAERRASGFPVQEESKEKILSRRLVVKCGTKNLCNPDTGILDQVVFNEYARQIVELQKLGIKVVIVSSGAIQAGREILIKLGKEEANYTKSQLSSLGQSVLMKKWTDAFETHKKAVGQILVTHANWENQEERESIKKNIFGLIDKGDIPILNENDSVSDKEIVLMDNKIGENDKLADMTTLLIGADAVLFLTDEGGVYTANPKIDRRAQLYEEIDVGNIPSGLNDLSGNDLSKGTGGITKKLEAASACARRGLRVAIASGKEKDAIINFASGKSVGTKIGVKNQL